MTNESGGGEPIVARARQFLAERLDPHARRGLGLTLRLLLFVLALWALSSLLDAVLDNAVLVRMDARVEAWFNAHATPMGLSIFYALTQLGSPVANVLIGVVAIYLWRIRNWQLFWTWLAANLGGKVLQIVLKDTVHRSRPQYGAAFLHGQSYSFPSGHVMNSTICYLFIAYIIAGHPNIGPITRRIAFAAAGVIILIVALSRLYLGVHYPSDVAGGFAAGLAWLSLCGITRQIAVTPDARAGTG